MQYVCEAGDIIMQKLLILSFTPQCNASMLKLAIVKQELLVPFVHHL